MNAMDPMLAAFVRNCPPTSVSTELQNILEVLLDFAGSKNSAVRERAVTRIERLSDFILSYFVAKISDYNEKYKDSHDDPRELYIPILGQLLGHLFIVSCGTDSISCTAFDALFRFYEIISDGRGKRRCGGQRPSAHRHLLVCLLLFPKCSEGLFFCLVEAAHGSLPRSLTSSAPHSSFPQDSAYRFPQKLNAHLMSRSSSLLLSFSTLPRSPTTLF
ncbi:uncharacterized protein LOC121063086 [Cygnus olor]|uniref:uncharacterized protein LOC121063086 n=1 Tax=Cygnus olor TaxID=8869 RepID=UPI001ADE5B77|nr:uncharacterized protein LOC121063086 [Cygnus olor]